MFGMIPQDCLSDFEDIMSHEEDRVHVHPNQLDGMSSGNPEDALIELIDLKHGYHEGD